MFNTVMAELQANGIPTATAEPRLDRWHDACCAGPVGGVNDGKGCKRLATWRDHDRSGRSETLGCAGPCPGVTFLCPNAGHPRRNAST
jgi:hypothetical protein